ncbi:MAG: hypothetical protein KAX49_03780 [Halanaerobiales bacterium]|nr:hypothetical protein [Halanaerobiales bacterium]
MRDIIENLRVSMIEIRTENRNIRKVILGVKSMMKLRTESGPFQSLRTECESDYIFGIPIKVMDILPKNYIGVEME